MDSNKPFNLTIFTNETKKLCICTATAIIIITLFVITPLSNFIKTSFFMKLVSLLIMIYIIYLNYNQIELLRAANSLINTEQVKSQLSINLICSYVFTLFIGLLIIFVIKSFF